MIWVWLLACLLIWYSPKESRWFFVVGVVLSVVVGVSTIWNSGWYMSLPFFETDLSEYCVAIDIMRDDWLAGDMPPKRSRLAALLPWLLSERLAILDALSLSSMICSVCTFVCVFIWGWSIFGTGPSLMGVLALSMMGPMVLMSRFLTFYPPIVFVSVFSAMSLALWWKFRHWGTAMLCGFGVGLCFCIDVRGVVWALPYWVGASCLMFTGDQQVSIWRRLGNGIALHVPIWSSWFVGWWAYTANSASLEKQMDVRPLYVGFDEDNPLFQPPWTIDSHFVWGWFHPKDIGQTLDFILTQRAFEIPPEFLTWQQTGTADNAYLSFWNGVLISTAILTVCAIWRHLERPWLRLEAMLLLICSVLPFIVLFDSLTEMVEQHIRFYLHGLPAFAILMAGAVACGKRIWSAPFALTRWYTLTWSLVVLGCGFGLHFTTQSPLYAQADWRNAWSITRHEYSQMRRYLNGEVIPLKAYGQECVETLQTEGITPTVYP